MVPDLSPMNGPTVPDLSPQVRALVPDLSPPLGDHLMDHHPRRGWSRCGRSHRLFNQKQPTQIKTESGPK